MEQHEFSIESRKDLQFRTAFKSGLEILSFQMTASFSDADKTMETLGWLFERAEVKLAGQWTPVKEKGQDIFYPDYLSEDLVALQEIAAEMMKFIKSVFQKSRESNR